MREGSRPAREKVFDAAYEAGVRHFDVAPLYGLGVAEKELGRLLLRVPADVTVATKFGLRGRYGHCYANLRVYGL
jgi:D-threo-aldose 1-dehydrogenase